MNLIWGEIAIGVKAVAEELGHDLSDEADLQRCVDAFQAAVQASRKSEEDAPSHDYWGKRDYGYWGERESAEEPSHGYWEKGDYS
jgi:hypothetical protein